MTIECYFSQCPHHSCHDSDDGPFCYEKDCIRPDISGDATPDGDRSLAGIHIFNTGRRYTEAGQRIAWIVRETKQAEEWHGPLSLVSFVDIDRGIWNEVMVEGEATDEKVLQAYDRMAYLYFGTPPIILTKLREAAAKAPTLT